MKHVGKERVVTLKDGHEIGVRLEQVDGEQPRIAFKGLPATMTPDEAAELARHMLELIAQGAEQPDGWPFPE